MFDRRGFLQVSATGLPAVLFNTSQVLARKPARKKRMAIVTTTWWYGSHAWHMATRFLVGYPVNGKWHYPDIEVVSAYVDQIKDDDLSKRRAKEFGFTVYPTIAEALRNGTDNLDVDCVLLIGEHGDYEVNEIGQKLYPRYRLFNGITEVFREEGKSVPIFNDKHLSWNFKWAEDMVAQSKALKFPFLAGSSLPVTWRMPSFEMPYGAEIEEAMVVAYGPKDIYDFHALETLQCMMERRKGGETGVKSIHALEGPSVWRHLAGRKWSAELFEACLSRSQTLSQTEEFSHRYPTPELMKQLVKSPVCYQLEYNDGTRATMMLMNGLVKDFNFAAKLKGQDAPLSTCFYLPPNPNVVYSAALMNNAEEMFMTNKAPYPVERTLLTSGMVQAALESLHLGQRKLNTPHLDVTYKASKESTFYRR
ncbi:MAG: hypothetical protein CMJ76_01990 [Planctomycetaceae bacterium]|nr:hypothetical protein [Planctomycetaceae bacterium]|tara:strand:+ start:38 stop:1300 length:1263 start_codon:yes stop_codon:yes gene_type:complete